MINVGTKSALISIFLLSIIVFSVDSTPIEGETTNAGVAMRTSRLESYPLPENFVRTVKLGTHMEVTYEVYFDMETIVFEVTGTTLGCIGFGIAAAAAYPVDMVIGGILPAGDPYFNYLQAYFVWAVGATDDVTANPTAHGSVKLNILDESG